MDNIFSSGNASTGDCIDDLLGATGSINARTCYTAQKSALAVILARLHASPWEQADRDAAAHLLHNIAGTAVYFDERLLGDTASRLEQPMRVASDPAKVALLCVDLLPLLQPH